MIRQPRRRRATPKASRPSSCCSPGTQARMAPGQLRRGLRQHPDRQRHRLPHRLGAPPSELTTHHPIQPSAATGTTMPVAAPAVHSAPAPASRKSKAPHPVTAFEWKQPRAVDAGKRGLGQPARHNASAATGAARGCRGRVATGSDRQSGRLACRLEGGGGRRTVMRVVPVPSSGHLDGGSPRTQPSSGPSHATACRPARHSGRLLLAC
jgi:hypothetical protein